MIATLTGEHAGAVSLIANSIPNRLIGRESFHPRPCRQRGLLPIVVGALQPRSQRGARNVTPRNASQSEDDMLGYLTAEGRFCGFDGGDWALLLAAFPLVALLALLLI